MSMMPGSDSLLEVAARATVLLSVALVLAWLARRRPAGVRHLLWTMTFALLVALPVLNLFGPAWEVSILPAASSSPLFEPPAIVAPVPGASAESISMPAPSPRSLSARSAAPPPAEAPSSKQRISLPLLLWGLGCAVSLASLVVGRVRFGESRSPGVSGLRPGLASGSRRDQGAGRPPWRGQPLPQRAGRHADDRRGVEAGGPAPGIRGQLVRRAAAGRASA